ncbi:MAG: alanine racemase [Nevskiaceae bacterium]|nr:alanine racemase [Nevskiaceae bacterium]
MKGLIRAQISAAALAANLRRIREQAPRSRVLAVIKANAYGHGSLPVARCLVAAGADALAVARLEEALALRAAGITAPVVLLEGVFTRAEMAEAVAGRLDFVVHDEEQLALLEQTAGGARACAVWMKIDTGMNRLGFRADAVAAAMQRLEALSHHVAGIRLMTHFACADDRASPMTGEQMKRFAALVGDKPYERSLANSAAIFAAPESLGDWVRPGLALYGVSPFADGEGAALGLSPAMRLVSTVITVRDVPAGESVGYGGVWRASRASRIAIVAAGYGDGLPWSLSSGVTVVIGAHRLPLVGRVSMDMIAVDVTGTPVSTGDEAVLWGPEQPVEWQARAARTIPYELLCGVSQRVPLQIA